MYLLDSSAIITPFHSAQCDSLGLALGHKSRDETYAWLERWYEYGFSSGNLTICPEIYDEVTKRSQKSRRERRLFMNFKENNIIKFLEFKDECTDELKSIHEFVESNYEPHQAQDFLRDVDPILVALAKVHKATLVVEERHFIPGRNGENGRITGAPKLPFVAAVFGVKCVSIMAVMLAEHRDWGEDNP